MNDRPQEAQDATGRRAYAFGYDDGSNMSAISKYDATGTIVSSTTCLVHDALGRLTTVGQAKVLAGPDARACKSESDLLSVAVRFRYDARNRRVGRQDGTGPWKQYAFTPTGTPLAELTRPTTSGGSWTPQREYVWLDGRPLAQVEYPGPAGGSEGHVYLVHVDHLGQPRALTTKTNFKVWAASAPRPYGDIDETEAIDPATNLSASTNLRLPGQYDERLLGSIDLKGPFYNYHRWYLPSLARYMELDPVALKGGLNGGFAPDWYGYANANPVRWTDPSGEIAGWVVGGLVGGFYGAFGAALSPGATWQSVGAGFVAGGLVGLLVGGLIDPSTAIFSASTIYLIQMGGGAVSGALGSIAGQVVQNGGFRNLNLNIGAVIGGGVGGALGGLFEGAVAVSFAKGAFPVGKWGTQFTGKTIGGGAGLAGEIAGRGFDELGFTRWEDRGIGDDWIRAAGCK